MQNEFVIFPKRGRMIGLGILAFVFVALGLFFIVISTKEDSSLLLGIIGVITAVFFGLCLLFYLKEIFVRKPALIISDEGIMDRSSFIGAGLVEWEDIEYLDFITFSGQLYLAIFTHDKQLIINRTTGIKRFLNRANRGLLDSQVNIPVKNLACSTDRLVDEINIRLHKDSVEADTD